MRAHLHIFLSVHKANFAWANSGVDARITHETATLVTLVKMIIGGNISLWIVQVAQVRR